MTVRRRRTWCGRTASSCGPESRRSSPRRDEPRTLDGAATSRAPRKRDDVQLRRRPGRLSAIVNRTPIPPPCRRRARRRRRYTTLAGYEPTPVHGLPAVATELGLGAVLVKDESNRLGLPAFKVLGAAWAIERALRERPDTHTLVAASAGNHGRAVARVAAWRGLRARIFLPGRSVPARRDAIEAGRRLVVVDGTYEDAVAQAAGRRGAGRPRGRRRRHLRHRPLGDRRLRDALRRGGGASGLRLIVVPAGVGSLAAAAARHGAHSEAKVVRSSPPTPPA